MTAGFVVALTTAIGLVLAGAATALRRRRYRAVFRVAPRRDDVLTIRGARPTISELTLEPSGLALPPGTTGNGQTAFLDLSVEATPAGRWADPFIEVQHGQVKFRQYFERGAVGVRHLNLSPLFQMPAGGALGRVHLRGRGLRWKRRARLTLFDAADGGGPRDPRVLVIAAHPDDAEIAAFGYYARHDSWVVTLTAGDAGDGKAGSSAVEALGMKASLRVWDSLTVPLQGHVPPGQCLNLVYPDGQLSDMHAAATRPFTLTCEAAVSRASLRRRNPLPTFQVVGADCTWDALVADLRHVLEAARPDIVVCPHPTLDAHPDHVFTALALDQALREHPRSPGTILLYAVHIEDVPLYPFGPADSLVSLPPWQDGSWVAESLFSWPLDGPLRRAKYFAVDAAHDLRKTCWHHEPSPLRRLASTIKQEVSAFVAGTAREPVSFLRRAPRPNELFYVVSAGGLSELAERSLARLRGGATAARRAAKMGGAVEVSTAPGRPPKSQGGA